MSFINPNFRNIQKKEMIKETKNIETLDINFDNVKLAGEPRRQDISKKEENIVSLDTIIKMEEKSKIEYIDSPSVANLNGVPRIEELNLSEVAKIQIEYFDKVENTMSM